MDLDNPIWNTLTGGYKFPYNASLPLKRLAAASRQSDFEAILDDLWENLHHQGDVGTASYLAIPQLVSICISKKSLHWKFIGLCVMIENCRLEKHNPEVPTEFQDEYLDALAELERYLLQNLKSITDQTSLRLSLALFATINGQPGLGKAIEIMDDDLLTEFLENH
jgi:hypothetical protein